MSRYILLSRTVAAPGEMVTDGYVLVDDGKVSAVGQGTPPVGTGSASGPVPVVDLGDALVAPGFIDVHVHGGGGHEVNRPTSKEVSDSVLRMAEFHAGHGTTALVATTVSDSLDALRVAVEGIVAVTAAGPSGRCGAEILGSHLEGPWIARSKAGAQYPGALRPPSLSELRELLELGKGTVRIVTLAPELEGAMEVIGAASAAGVVVSIGHTDADNEIAQAAFAAGARHATHLFNAMAPIHHRHPGPVAAALGDERVSLEIISDGVHIHPALISLVAGLAPSRLVLVTDAIGATGTAPGLHRLGPLDVVVRDGKAVLAGQEHTVAGSVLTMDQAVALAVKVAKVPLEVALSAASKNPAEVLGLSSKGRLAPGCDADIVVMSPDFSVVATIVGGQVVHDATGLLQAVGQVAGRAPGDSGASPSRGSVLVGGEP